jgi:hypothetical protein
VKQFTYSNDKSFNSVLIKLGVKKDQLVWGIGSDAYSSSLSQILYYPAWREYVLLLKVKEKKILRLDDNKSLTQLSRDFWKQHKDSLTASERISLICSPKQDNEFWRNNFWIYRIEDWDVKRNSRTDYERIFANMVSRKYFVFIPGVTIKDISVSGRAFKESEVREAIKILTRSNLIEPVKMGYQTRYVIRDNMLHHFISGLKEYFISEIDCLVYRWQIIERPTEIEKERMKSIFGEHFKKIEMMSEIKLAEHKKGMRSCSNIEQYNELLKNGIRNVLDGSMLDLELEQYKTGRRKIPTGRNDHRKDIENYRKFRKENQDALMSKLPICCREHNEMDIFKRAFSGTIEKYSFLRDILLKICPKILDAPIETK